MTFAEKVRKIVKNGHMSCYHGCHQKSRIFFFWKPPPNGHIPESGFPEVHGFFSFGAGGGGGDVAGAIESLPRPLQINEQPFANLPALRDDFGNTALAPWCFETHRNDSENQFPKFKIQLCAHSA